MSQYTHPGNPATVMRAYRGYLMGRKREWRAKGKGHRCLRGLIYYRHYVDQYVAAKRLVLAGLPHSQDVPHG